MFRKRPRDAALSSCTGENDLIELKKWRQKRKRGDKVSLQEMLSNISQHMDALATKNDIKI